MSCDINVILHTQLFLSVQNISREAETAPAVSMLVAVVTSEPNNLEAADVSASVSVVDQLTNEATHNPEVLIITEQRQYWYNLFYSILPGYR